MIEITEIACPLKHGGTEQGCIETCTRETLRLLGCARADIARVTLHRKSIDARKKSNVHFTLTARVELAPACDEAAALEHVGARDRRRVRIIEVDEPSFCAIRPRRQPHAGERPVVVGAGCAGLFAALTLSEAGLAPILIEMGDDARRRTKAVERFNATGELDLESNIQFGLGGAGTFSDGKLNTGTKNPLHRLVIKTFVEAGAPREILWDAKPHIGSDILPEVVTRIVERIRANGGDVLFRTKLLDIQRDESGAVQAVRVRSASGRITDTSIAAAEIGDTKAGDPNVEARIPTRALILACGHSARDVFGMLRRRYVALERKTFAMGVRIEHLQPDIDRALYGIAAGHPALGAAPYSLVAHLEGGRSVFSFCMCPGGEVVAAASEEGGVVTNGASLHARAGRNANAALLVNITPEDLPGSDPLEGIRLQRHCEQAAFAAGGGAYRAPAQLVGDFLDGKPSTGPGRVLPTYPRGVTWGAIDDLLPAHVIDTLRAGLPLLARKLRGYDSPDAVLTAVETRSSSPITITRDRGTCISVNTPGLIPCGEGAGYAGGIMSAATDGIRCAQALIAQLDSDPGSPR